MTWRSADLPVITAYDTHWSAAEAAFVLMLPEKAVREAIRRMEIPPAGKRPGSGGRGRTPIVYAASDLVAVLC